MKKNHLVVLIVIVLAAFGVYYRLTPHPANFAPISAIALFSGAYLPRKWAFALPIGIVFFTDLFLGFYEPAVMLSVYGCFAISALVGGLLKNNKNVFNIAWLAIFSSVLFFIVTNFAVWTVSQWYPHNFSGLALNYYLALPFFKNTLFSDLFFSGVLFGAYESVKIILPLRLRVN